MQRPIVVHAAALQWQSTGASIKRYSRNGKTQDYVVREKPADVERLLIRGERARLPLPRQFLLYLDPFALFKDASKGTALVRASALSYNRAMRWVLVPYIRRWIMIAASLFLAIAPTEALAAEAKIFVIPAAAFAVGASIAIAVSCLIAAVYLLLGSRRE